MEPITSTSSFIRFIHLVLLLRKLSKTRSAYPKLPPGPKTLPIIGNIHQLSGSQPHRALTDLAKKHGQVMHLQRGEVSTVVISSAQMAKEALKTHDVALVNRPRILAAQTITYNFQDVSFSPYGGYWRQMRKMSLPVNLTDLVFALTNAVTCRSAFGSRCTYQDQLVQLINEIIEVSSGFDISDLVPSKKFLHIISGTVFKIKKLQSKLDPIFESKIQEHKEADSGEDMFAAGTDTSAATVLWAVIKETLRLHPPVPLLLPRECREPCETGGYDVSVGTRVLIDGWAINRDPEFWEDPESFKPERFLDNGIEFVGSNFEYLPFGGGRRICPGIAFGVASVDLALAQLVSHFDWKLPGEQNQNPST
nr:premnaspirodiene oxygenase-like [Coffea arabica]